MKKFEMLGKKLSKAEQKGITGGVLDACTVTCSTGYYACCCAGDCRCILATDQTNYGCSGGGPGATTCSYDWQQS